MELQELREELATICERHVLEEKEDVVFAEPYIPYVPENWNRVLVLAEAQNLSKTNKTYVDGLTAKTPLERMQRLSDPGNLGVGPWDDGTLKFALKAALDLAPEDTAVSNSVPWSQKGKANKNPSGFLRERSVSLWREFIPKLNPLWIVTAGKVARITIAEAIKEISWKGKIIKLRSASQLSRVSGLFFVGDLLLRYPEVERVMKANPDWVKSRKQDRVFYACHAVSSYAEVLQQTGTPQDATQWDDNFLVDAVAIQNDSDS